MSMRKADAPLILFLLLFLPMACPLAQDIYKALRSLSASRLWTEHGGVLCSSNQLPCWAYHASATTLALMIANSNLAALVPCFDAMDSRAREQNVGLVRAIGVKFSAQDLHKKAMAREWLLGLLDDPSEKVRRYATAAIPKLVDGGDEVAELALLRLLDGSSSQREQRSIGEALSKIGGAASLESFESGRHAVPLSSEQRLRAKVARVTQPSALRFDELVHPVAGMRLHFRSRRGLEEVLASELREHPRLFRCLAVESCCVVVEPLAPFSLADVYRLRCFDTVGILLASIDLSQSQRISAEVVASAIASKRCEALMRGLTDGALRYRLSVGELAHEVEAGEVARSAYTLNSCLLNDPSEPIWLVELHHHTASDRPSGQGLPGGEAEGERLSVELRPRLSPNPRLAYQTATYYAGAHPPLAAAMARLAGSQPLEVAWDPFCGAGTELIEVALRGSR